MTLAECRTADDVRALNRLNRERHRKRYQVAEVGLHPWSPSWPLNDSRLGGTIKHPFYMKCGMPEYKVTRARLTIDLIKRTVSKEMDVSVHDMEANVRTKRPTKARQIVCYLARKLTLHSLPDIGRKLGDRDHTTIYHAVNRIEDLRRRDHALDELVTRLSNHLARQGR